MTLAGWVRLPDGRTAEWQEESTVKTLLDRDWTALSGRLKGLADSRQLSLLREVARSEVGTLTFPQPIDEATVKKRTAARRLVSSGWLEMTPGGAYRIPGDRLIPLLVLLLAASGD